MYDGAISLHSEVLSWTSLDFPRMIESAGALPVVEAIAQKFKVGETRMRDIIENSGPFLLRAHVHWMDRPEGRERLDRLVRSGGPQQFADKPTLVCASVSEQEGREFLKFLFLDDEVVELITQRIAARLGMHPDKLGQMLPNLAALFVGCLCKSMTP